MKKTAPVLSLILFCALFFAGCSEKNKDMAWFEYDYYGVMNTDAVLKIYCDGDEKENESRFLELAAEVKNLLSGIENSLSCEIETSYVSRFNAAECGGKVELDEYAYDALSTAMEMYEFTGGAYNPAVYYSVKAYGFNDGGKMPQTAKDLPKDDEIEQYTELSKGFAEIELKEKDGGYYAIKPQTTVGGEELTLKIDLGGLGKGYAADKVNGLIERYGFKYGYFNFGTSSIAFKQYPDESREFNLRFTNPRRDAGCPQSYLSVGIKDECVSTSGDYENYYMLDLDGDGEKERLCHIIDPFTGKPVQKGIAAVTVIGGKAAENDALTTAIMAMGTGKAVEFIQSELSDRRVAFVCADGGELLICTNMQGGDFTVDDSRYKIVLPPRGGSDVA